MEDQRQYTIEKINIHNHDIAVVYSETVQLSCVQTTLDFMMTIYYDTGHRALIINKEAIIEEFFDLSSRIAGDILQKFVNYQFKLAIVGDFSMYSSPALKDFIYECNRGREICFVNSLDEAYNKMSKMMI